MEQEECRCWNCSEKEEYDISDVQLRSILGGLQEQGLITIGRGRQGMKLTEKGMKAIG